MKVFWTTWVDGTTGGYGYKHPTLDEAKKEAERLSQLPGNIGKPVRVLQWLGSITCKNTVWESAESETFPF